MQQDDVRRKPRAAAIAPIQYLPHGSKRLLIGKMPAPTHDPLLQEIRPIALLLHERVIIAFDGQHIQVDEPLDQFSRHPAQVRRIADPAAEALDQKTV